MKYLIITVLLFIGMAGYSQKQEVGKVLGIDSLRAKKGVYDLSFELSNGTIQIIGNCPKNVKDSAVVNPFFLLTYMKSGHVHLLPIKTKK